MPYVVTEGQKVPRSGGEPVSIRGVYDDWPSCLAAITGSTGPKQMKVSSREEADAILSGKGVVLAPGLYAFTDGNSSGGVGVAIVQMGDDERAKPQALEKVATSVTQVFRGAAMAELESDLVVNDARERLSMHLAEIAAVYVAVSKLPSGTDATIVYDRKAVGAVMEGQSQERDPATRAIVSRSKQVAEDKQLHLSFKFQPGHGSEWAGRHDYAKYNALADELAQEGSDNITTNDV
jgi:ribonuclease HI